MKRSLILTALSFLVLAQLGLAQVPQTFSYQGVLRDKTTGDIVADDDYDVIFSLYDNVGNSVWSETHSNGTGNAVTVTDGVFSVILGKDTPLSGLSSPPTELGIKIGADEELSPRIELTSVLYSMNAQAVKGPDNVFPGSGSVGIGTANPTAKLEVVGDASVDGNLTTTGDATVLGNLDVLGTITQSAQTEYYSFSVRDATSGGTGGDNNYVASYRNDATMYGSLNLTIPLHLPHGATITSITIYIDDSDVTSSVRCLLYSMASTDFTLLEISLTPHADFYTTNSGPHSASTTLSHSVDNQTERFWLRITSGAPDGIGDYIRFYGGQIMYFIN